MTAKEYFNDWNLKNYYDSTNNNDLLKIMDDYAAYKCKELLDNGWVALYPPQYKFLEDKFTYDSKDRAFKSKRKRLGAGNGDDLSLFLSVDSGGTLIWWKENRGSEDVIFDGRELKTEEEFNQVFELLGLKTLLKWE